MADASLRVGSSSENRSLLSLDLCDHLSSGKVTIYSMVSSKTMKIWGLNDVSVLMTLAALSEDPGVIPSPYPVIHNDLELQSQGLPHLLLASVGTTHIWHTEKMQKKKSHRDIK